MVSMTLLCAAFLYASALPRMVAAADVELELALAIDVSASVNDSEYALQRYGTAAAFRDPDVHRAVAASAGGIAVVIYQWASLHYQRVAVPWTVLRTSADLNAYADRVGRMIRQISGGGTMMHAGLEFGGRVFGDNIVRGRRQVIDLAANGIADDQKGLEDVRRDLLAKGIVINGLAIEEDRQNLTSYFRDYVIGGPNAFVVTAWSFEDFARAMRTKLLREIRNQPVAAVPTPFDGG